MPEALGIRRMGQNCLSMEQMFLHWMPMWIIWPGLRPPGDNSELQLVVRQDAASSRPCVTRLVTQSAMFGTSFKMIFDTCNIYLLKVTLSKTMLEVNCGRTLLQEQRIL
eukprot:2710258-Amphidinium_carterae.2